MEENSDLFQSKFDSETINKLSSGVQDLQSKDFLNLRHLISEALLKQDQMVANLTQTNKCNKFEENNDLSVMFTKAKSCDAKLKSLKRKMTELSNRSKSLKKRALHIHQTKQQETLNRIQEEDARVSREERMIAKPKRDT
ncbi:biogenesis of lysosome-related organelles complex 1 subunit 6 isoform X1 [Nilaparvata lugens]|uniref:biogenesis of lysosome-related organelles complex 1 subunit 6 isoform X1 n=1 Tax=Nilaparvata lugens TaxID=108931 RepID=UPI000B982ABC|nr:biogenesis of lysosome-related organelles complex 1 subunit 6 isoform X1 [Nilaparvata lugens]